MKIVTKTTSGTNSREYVTLKNLQYAPSADVISERVAVDEFEADIVTDDDIRSGLVGELRDDTKLWAAGRVVYAEHKDPKTVHVRIQSELFFLDRKMMPAKMYNAVSVQTAIEEIATTAGITILFNASAVSGVTVTGFCDEQSCRNRLQYILFACGLYITSSFVEHPTVTNLTNALTAAIPEDVIYWRPTPTYEEAVTAVNVTAFSFTQGTPSSGEEYVTDGITTWIVTRQNVRLTNPNVPALSATNEVHIEDVMLITQANASLIASLLGQYYFTRMSVDFDCINNGEYAVGNVYAIPLGDGYTEGAQGFAEELDYSFGTQAKSRVKLGSCANVDCHKLTIIYRYSSKVIEQRFYTLPEGFPYSITTEYLRKSYEGQEYVFRPTTAAVTGTMGSSDVTTYVDLAVALQLDLSTRILTVISVDDYEHTDNTLEID